MTEFVMTEFMLGAIIGSLLTGAIVGAIPAVCGAIKQKFGLAIGGFFACLGSALLLGLILAVPMCALFLFLIFKKPKSSSTTDTAAPDTPNNTAA